MKKRILLTMSGLVVLIAALTAVKVLQIGAMIDQGKKFVPPPETVTTSVVRPESWETALTAIGSLSAVQGVTVAAELPGKVVKIVFVPGNPVKKGDLLIHQDTTSEEAQLPGAVAQTKLTRGELERAVKMLSEKIISQADYDRAMAAHEQAMALANNIRATIAKKAVRAPFSGRLGIRQVNLGQILKEGDPIVTLQSLDPIYVDFTLPQQESTQLRPGLPVRLKCDTLPGVTVEGRITAISPLVDSETRNIRVQATAANRAERLKPGMFVTVSVGLPVQRKVLTIPSTAVLYAPFGDSVYTVQEAKDRTGKKMLRQQFVRLGEKRGDFVAVTSGLKEGEIIVSSGVFKLRNGQTAVIDNRLALPYNQSPKPENN